MSLHSATGGAAPSEPKLASHLVANLAGPEAVPASVYTPQHRAYVLGEA